MIYLLIYLLFIFSPLTLLLIERGNTDIFMAMLLFLSEFFIKNDLLSHVFIFIGGIIKIFPILGLLGKIFYDK